MAKKLKRREREKKRGEGEGEGYKKITRGRDTEPSFTVHGIIFQVPSSFSKFFFLLKGFGILLKI